MKYLMKIDIKCVIYRAYLDIKDLYQDVIIRPYGNNTVFKMYNEICKITIKPIKTVMATYEPQ